jgi:hypothetical protein
LAKLAKEPRRLEPHLCSPRNNYLIGNVHKSVDNLGVARREAMVLHYAPTDTKNLADPKLRAIHDKIYRWKPVERTLDAAIQ